MWRCVESKVDPDQRDILPQLREDYPAAFKGHLLMLASIGTI